jgi:hypothetical protein
MQEDTEYVDLLSSVVGFLRNRLERAVAAGIPDDKILLDPGSRTRRYLNDGVVREMFDEHVRGTRSHGHRLWTLINLELWCRMLEDGSMSQPMPEEAESDWPMAAGAGVSL